MSSRSSFGSSFYDKKFAVPYICHLLIMVALAAYSWRLRVVLVYPSEESFTNASFKIWTLGLGAAMLNCVLFLGLLFLYTTRPLQLVKASYFLPPLMMLPLALAHGFCLIPFILICIVCAYIFSRFKKFDHSSALILKDSSKALLQSPSSLIFMLFWSIGFALVQTCYITIFIINIGNLLKHGNILICFIALYTFLSMIWSASVLGVIGKSVISAKVLSCLVPDLEQVGFVKGVIEGCTRFLGTNVRIVMHRWFFNRGKYGQLTVSPSQIAYTRTGTYGKLFEAATQDISLLMNGPFGQALSRAHYLGPLFTESALILLISSALFFAIGIFFGEIHLRTMLSLFPIAFVMAGMVSAVGIDAVDAVARTIILGIAKGNEKARLLYKDAFEGACQVVELSSTSSPNEIL